MKLNWDKIIYETYVELFKEATPSANFDELLQNSALNDRGQMVIPFYDYEIDQDKMYEILNSFIKKYKIPKQLRGGYEFNILLGCSPKTKINDKS